MTGAVLTALDLSDCRLRTARFDRATIMGNTWFMSANFTDSTFTHEVPDPVLPFV